MFAQVDIDTDFCLNTYCKVIPRYFKDSKNSRLHKNCLIMSLEELQQDLLKIETDPLCNLERYARDLYQNLDNQYENIIKYF